MSYANGGGAINTDLKGLNSLQVPDQIIKAAGAIGLRVILDNHRSEVGNSAEANGLWYTNTYPESAWINDWKTMVSRYSGYTDGSGNPTLIVVDLRNEPHLIANGSEMFVRISSLENTLSRSPSQSLHEYIFSKIQAASPMGESVKA